MNEKFIFGLALGMLGGAVIATNSVKARQMVKSGQQQVVEKAETLTKKKSKKNSK
ncbi:MAG: hypothetical protein IJQ23_04410 [Clostridia bacterium]|nr:hypothetical protein [Clostridia bacterium]